MDFLSESEFQSKVAEWIDQLNVDQNEKIDFDKPALIIVDMQKEFLSPEGLIKVWGGPAIMPNLTRLVKEFHKSRMPVFYTRMIYDNPEIDGGATARFWKMDENSMILRNGTWHAELHDELKPDSQDIVIVKRRYSAFFGTDLDLHLRTLGIADVVIAGVSSHICCEATAHDALFRDYNVYFLIDGTGGNDEESHLAVLRNIGSVYGYTVTTDQVINAIGNDQ